MPAKRVSAPPAGQAIVRMYRQGLGDCFLLVFRGDKGKPVYMLIDCGVWDNDAATMKQMERVVKDIKAASGGHLHILVCTHEHWDHNSGFLQHRKIFEAMTIDHVWLAWTEDPAEPLAAELKAEFEKKRRKLALAMNRLRGAHPALARQVANLVGLPAAGGGKADPAGAMKWVRDRGANKSTVRFCSPGDVVAIPGTRSARVLVLGPPMSRKMLAKNLAGKKETEQGDVYHLRFANSLADEAFFAAAEHAGKTPDQIEALSSDEREQYELSVPFDISHHVSPDRAGAIPLLAGSYFDPAEAWRRIDGDWLSTAARIALWMDSSTNNTSLVLAIEPAPHKGVLLFAADAQVGNWKSWRDVRFAPPDDGITIDDLLARTVLYKVGHHGSHNATLRRDGLEKMTGAHLAAMIPVNRASVEKKGWKMPFAPMYRALERAAGGRIIRADEGVQPRPAGADAKAYNAFKKRCKTDPVYIQYTISG